MLHHIQNYNLNQIVTDTIDSVNVTKYKNYPSILILTHANVLAEVIKSHNVHYIRLRRKRNEQ